jgi:hypothetical protein
MTEFFRQFMQLSKIAGRRNDGDPFEVLQLPYGLWNAQEPARFSNL